MDLRQLQFLVRAVECASISRAAQALNMAQPSLSQRIRELEEELGVVLLDRFPHGVRATEAGALVVERARAVLRLVDMMASEARSVGRDPVGDVVIGLPTTAALHLTLPLVEITRQRHPKIKLRILEGMSGHVQEWLLSGRLDMSVLYSVGPHPGLAVEQVTDEELCLISRFDRARAGLAAQCRDLRSYPLVLPGPDHGLRRAIEAARRPREERLDVAVEVDSLVHLKRLVAEVGLHTILPQAACREEIAAGKLMARRIVGPAIRRPITMATSTSRPLSIAARAIYDLVRAMLRGEAPGGEPAPRDERTRRRRAEAAARKRA
jgi:LysR family nitrogen assimilation transcriptional regulator